ncbi:uncharacterized protein LOC105170617 [Sesamum indicum]|uniref:Uncharacterized protein LOC105170617 n=1 Tax=Sesamum indicum TaxID=4182 RepID=A0A6I9TUU0_SESIN|nr:uncharacterized protein LOC105170617 [Sesamum indicum]
MMRCGGCGLTRTVIEAWIRDYDNLQWLAVKLIYAQIACALIGSLAPLYNGVLLVDLGISLFALVAIESSSQSLARTYAFLLFCSVFLDLSWFLLFSHDIWRTPPEFHGTFLSILVNLTLAMQIVGFSVRLSSSLLWIQMYRLGVSTVDNSGARDTDGDLRNSFLNPATPIVRRSSDCDDVVGGAIYDPAYYSSLFEDGKDDTYHSVDSRSHDISRSGSPSAAETSQLDPSMHRSFHVKDDENAVRKLQIV